MEWRNYISGAAELPFSIPPGRIRSVNGVTGEEYALIDREGDMVGLWQKGNELSELNRIIVEPQRLMCSGIPSVMMPDAGWGPEQINNDTIHWVDPAKEFASTDPKEWPVPMAIVSESGFIVLEPWYTHICSIIEKIIAILGISDFIPEMNGWHPQDIFAEISIKIQDIGLKISFPVILIITLIVFKTKNRLKKADWQPGYRLNIF